MDETKTAPNAPDAAAEKYEAPRIERTLTPEDLAREVQYAGGPSLVPGD